MPAPANVEETRREAGLRSTQPARERFAHAWRLTTRYYVSEDWKAAWLLLILYAALSFGTVYTFILLNQWQRAFFDSIEQRQSSLFVTLIFTFLMISGFQVAVIVVNNLVSWTLSMRWRNWLTDWYMDRWFAHDRFYEIERLRMIDNPDQRIAEDIKNFTLVTQGNSLVGIAIGIISSLISAVSFGYILLQASSALVIPIAGYQVSLPGGDLIWVSIGYVLFGSVVITWIGRPYIRRRMREQHYEADFRSNLIHVRRNGEQIAFSRTQDMERRGLRVSFANIRRNWYRLMWANIGLSAGSSIYERVMTVIPLFLTVPRFFAGLISFGQVMAARDAFTQFSSSLSYFVQVYPGLAVQIANINRLKALDDSIDNERPRGIAFLPGEADEGIAIHVKDLELRRPNGEPLLALAEWKVRDGERWVIEGPSGAGKTTLLRAIAGLWPDGAGSVAMTGNGIAMLVPQRLYLPLGSLKNAICFPDHAEDHDDETIAALLEQVRLGTHADDMHQVRMWQDELSPGEQQRVALARILLQRPTLLVLDEATSALDADNAAHFYEAVRAAMPDATIVSVVHNEKLAAYHTHRVQLHDGHATTSMIEAAV
ncbi:MAG: ABC transporter ATP-binding protein/permease [Alphaproteobacteria bacterium]|nr:ABC transporter ATP-binding protein/permease [Alphaproteobacteria bacterium]MBU0792579.1 ABC transporter ATP-binding protein/permease [Alphaproteobacteria bacterium]MBU0874789.1 ABC transporter ATP-binding protein/permease [Alphaproteobacteria bacterium]MBU1768647.1 ABC transporter ATP-binding protein/permease [Alphaproteobacteria bacterium]